MSAAGRARIAAAARARWARLRAAKQAAKPAQKPRRKISAAGPTCGLGPGEMEAGQGAGQDVAVKPGEGERPREP
jgi:hypothetical protein